MATTDVEALKAKLKPMLVNGIKTSPHMKTFRKSRISVLYVYSDPNGNFLFQIKITPEIYEN